MRGRAPAGVPRMRSMTAFCVVSRVTSLTSFWCCFCSQGSIWASRPSASAANVDMIQAQVFENTPGGLTVFQRLGFRIEAVLRGFALDIKGERQNMVVLVRDVAELWKSMEDMLWESDWRGDS